MSQPNIILYAGETTMIRKIGLSLIFSYAHLLLAANQCIDVFSDTNLKLQNPIALLQEQTSRVFKQNFSLKSFDGTILFPKEASFYKDAKFVVAKYPKDSNPAESQIFYRIDFGYQLKDGFRKLGTANYIILDRANLVLEIGCGSKEMANEIKAHIFGRQLLKHELNTIIEINNKIFTALRNNPKAQGKMREFAEKRKWPAGIIEQAQLVYYSHEILPLAEWAKKNNYTMTQIRDAGWGLLKFDESGVAFLDISKEDSVKIPFFNNQHQTGIPVWRTRNIEKRTDGKKYLGWQIDRSIDREFQANETLYNAWKLPQAKGKPIIITEGEFKCMIAEKSTGILTLGIPGITQFEKSHAKAIVEAKPSEVIVILDRDPKGKGLMRVDGITDSQRAAYTIAKMLKDFGQDNVKVGQLPDAFNGSKVGIDDLILAQGVEPYLNTIKNATSIVEYAQRVGLDTTLHELHIRYQALVKSWENYKTSKTRSGQALNGNEEKSIFTKIQQAKINFQKYLSNKYNGAHSFNEPYFKFQYIQAANQKYNQDSTYAVTRDGQEIKGSSLKDQIILLDSVTKNIKSEICAGRPCYKIDLSTSDMYRLASPRSGLSAEEASIAKNAKEIVIEHNLDAAKDLSTVLLAAKLRSDFPKDEYDFEFNVKIKSPIGERYDEVVPLVIYKKENGKAVVFARLRTEESQSHETNYLFNRVGNALRP